MPLAVLMVGMLLQWFMCRAAPRVVTAMLMVRVLQVTPWLTVLLVMCTVRVMPVL